VTASCEGNLTTHTNTTAEEEALFNQYNTTSQNLLSGHNLPGIVDSHNLCVHPLCAKQGKIKSTFLAFYIWAIFSIWLLTNRQLWTHRPWTEAVLAPGGRGVQLRHAEGIQREHTVQLRPGGQRHTTGETPSNSKTARQCLNLLSRRVVAL